MRRIVMAVTGVIAVIGLATAAIGGRKVGFVGSCLTNGKAISDCACMYEARADFLRRNDLPPIYGDLARSWALEAPDAYRSKVYSTVFWQSVRAVPVVRDVLMGAGDSKRGSADQTWNRIARTLSEQIIGQVSQRLGVSIVPWVQGAKMASDAAEPVWDFTRAQAVVSKHCGGRMHEFVAPIETAHRQIVEQLSSYTGSIADAMTRLRRAMTIETVTDAIGVATRKAADGVGVVKDKTLSWYGAARDKARAVFGLAD